MAGAGRARGVFIEGGNAPAGATAGASRNGITALARPATAQTMEASE